MFINQMDKNHVCATTFINDQTAYLALDVTP